MENWILRLAGKASFKDVTLKDLLPAAALARKCGVAVDVQALLALSDLEREALSLADAAIQVDAIEELWADDAREDYVRGLRDGG